MKCHHKQSLLDWWHDSPTYKLLFPVDDYHKVSIIKSDSPDGSVPHGPPACALARSKEIHYTWPWNSTDALKEPKQLKTDMIFGKWAKYMFDFSDSTEVMWVGGGPPAPHDFRTITKIEPILCSFSKSHVRFQLLWFFQSICEIPRPCVMDFFAPRSSSRWRPVPYTLSAAANSMYSQLSSLRNLGATHSAMLGSPLHTGLPFIHLPIYHFFSH